MNSQFPGAWTYPFVDGFRKFIPESVSYDDTRDYIMQALEFYQKYRTKAPTQTNPIKKNTR